MITIIPADKRHFTDYGWLKTYWLFSFSDYYDPSNIQHGPLRVFNDDVVAPVSGFPTHPHHEMEIITLVLEGAITHKDSMGNETIIRAGEVQSMSAGTGVTHSEYNMEDEKLHLYQIWIVPARKGLEPSYDQKMFKPDLWKNKIVPVASGQGFDNAVGIHADASIYRSELEKGIKTQYDAGSGRYLFMYIREGEMEINDRKVGKNDQVRTRDVDLLELKSTKHAEFILIDLPGD